MPNKERTKLQRITSLWKIKSGLSGSIGVQRIVILKNAKKDPKSNQPDYYLYYDTNQPQDAVKTEKIQDEDL